MNGLPVPGSPRAERSRRAFDVEGELALHLVADPRQQELAQNQHRGRGGDEQQGEKRDQHSGADTRQERLALTRLCALGRRATGPRLD